MKITLKYSVYISHSTKESISNSIVKEIEQSKFNNIEVRNDEVCFKNEFWKFGTSLRLTDIITYGSFKLRSQDNDTELLYESTASFLFDVTLILISLIVGVMVHFVFILFSVGLLVQIFIKMNIMKTGNKALVKRVLARLGEDPAIEVTQKFNFKPR